MQVILIDFDGTINSYRSGFTRDGDIPDPPLEGAQDAIMRLRKQFRVIVFSARARSVEGKNAIIAWLAKNSIEVDGITATKIPAFCQVDDTSIKFDGNWVETQRAIEDFQTWQDREALTRELMVPEENLPKTDELVGLFDKGVPNIPDMNII